MTSQRSMNRVKNERSEVQRDERKREEKEGKREKRENEVSLVKCEILVKFFQVQILGKAFF